MDKITYEEKMNEQARQGRFDEYVNDISKIRYTPVDDKFVYLPKNIFFKLLSLIVRFLMAALGPILVWIVYHIKVEGRQNLKGVKKAITVSNHVLILDILLNRTACFGHRQYVTGASFNNRIGMGTILKAGGLFVFGETFTAQKNLNKAIEKVLKKNCYVHFYSEQALWLNYEKSRPYKIGAFRFASNLNLPIIPITICFRKPPKFMFWRKNKFVTVVISKPIYPNNELNKKEREKDLLCKAQAAYDNTIIDFYNYDKSAYTYLGSPSETKKRGENG